MNESWVSVVIGLAVLPIATILPVRASARAAAAEVGPHVPLAVTLEVI